MSEPVHNHINPAIANSIAAAWARRKEAFSRNRASGVPLTADNLQSAAAVDQHRILALQNSENNQQHWEGNMDYMQNSYAFTPQSHTQMYFQPVPYPSYVSHPQQQIEDYYNPYEYGDFFDSGMMHDEFGEVQEISTRPRLTKEQSEILEAHFQANHKPSAQVKRQLAIQTNLKLTRVGNWFQNRRAKAKQQKRQEEYEAQNAASKAESNEEPPSSPSKREAASPARSTASPTKESVRNFSSAANSPSPTKGSDSAKEASWASLQRALGHAKSAQVQRPPQSKTSMSPPELPSQTASVQLPLRLTGHHPSLSTSSATTWSNQNVVAAAYPSPITLQDNSFDFGFDKDVLEHESSQSSSTADQLPEYAHDTFVVTPEDWQEPLATPKGQSHQQTTVAEIPSPGLSMPSYPGSRRQSTTDDLSNNFGNFALASSSPGVPTARRASELIRPPQSGPLDIAARRKRPRPAALTSASLRSRSYGAMTSVSPTFRQGVMSPQAPHTVRHVKSAGHSLNSRYAGVRKASSAQRSPICATSLGDAEAFNQLMAQQALNAQTLAELPPPLLSPDIISNSQMTDPEKNPFFAQNMVSNQFGFHPVQNVSLTSASPPITPMIPDFMSRAQSQQSLAPPASAPPQYASFPDYTPPYSAGPLTNSSWSDAPLTSPEVTSFPPVTYVSSLGYHQQGESLNGSFQQFVLPSDNTSDFDLDSQLDLKKTEFYIQEFPNQKEEHAHVAQQLAQQKPKSYVFANTAPQDYTVI